LKNRLLIPSKVLPLAEETESHDEELFSINDIKLEVMRSRGAGGQVTFPPSLAIYFPI
jgi:protein subunit release factor A